MLQASDVNDEVKNSQSLAFIRGDTTQPEERIIKP